MTDIEQFIDHIPKIELHMHLEGSLEPELMFRLAQKNKIDIPFKTVDDVRAAYKFTDLQSFLDIYYQGMNVLRTEDDFYDLTFAYLTRVHNQNVVHTEVFFDPQGHTDRGVAFGTVINGIHRALQDGQKEFGISSKLIMCFLRHLDEESALKTLNEAKPYRHLITGVGLDSSENGHPPSKFETVFRDAGQQGYKRVAHAGEEGPAPYVWEALNILNVDRIDHGNRSMEDETLIDTLVQANIGLTVCPLSNTALCNVSDMKLHPLKDMLNKGVKVMVNSDDPAYFGGYMTENFKAVTNALNLDKDDIIKLSENAIDVSFLSPYEKAQKHIALQDFVRSFE
jgi:adenosine deaminase